MDRIEYREKGREKGQTRNKSRSTEEQTGDDGGDLDQEREAEVATRQPWIYFRGRADEIC